MRNAAAGALSGRVSFLASFSLAELAHDDPEDLQVSTSYATKHTQITLISEELNRSYLLGNWNANVHYR